MSNLLEVKNLSIRYYTREGILTSVRNASFDVKEGEIVGIVGESGCGKSTVASAVMRLLPPNGEICGGSITFKGENLCEFDDEDMRRLRGTEMSMIFQDPMTSLNPVFTIETQMMDALKAHHRGDGSKALRERAFQMLDRVGITDVELRIKEYPHQFSGGMRQRIMIAMALLSNPSFLIADEPTTALDVTLEAQILDLIRGLRDELGTAILYISHDLGVMAQLCDKLIVMYAGNIVEAGDIYDLFDKPQHPYTQALLRSHPSASQRSSRLATIPGRVPSLKDLPTGCKFAPRCEKSQAVCMTTEPSITQLEDQMVLCHAYQSGWDSAGAVIGRGPATAQAVASGVDDGIHQEVVVETKGLRTYFPDDVGFLAQILGQKGSCVRAVDGVDIAIRRGETVGLVGESGSGKTTIGRTILRLENPTSGDIFIDGRNATQLSQSELRPMRAKMQMIFQDPYSSLSPRMKVSGILLEPFRIHDLPVQDPKKKVVELLSMVGLSDEQADKYPHQLSGGQARRVGIARALALNPDLLIADEPTAGLDVSVAASVLNLMKDLREKLDLSYLIITHNLNVISFIADRVAVMYLGKVVELAETDDIFDHPRHPYTEALMSAMAVPDPRLRDKKQRIVLQGEIPSPRTPPPGCTFHPRCRYAEEICSREIPLLRDLGSGGHLASCHFPERVGTWQTLGNTKAPTT